MKLLELFAVRREIERHHHRDVHIRGCFGVGHHDIGSALGAGVARCIPGDLAGRIAVHVVGDLVLRILRFDAPLHRRIGGDHPIAVDDDSLLPGPDTGVRAAGQKGDGNPQGHSRFLHSIYLSFNALGAALVAALAVLPHKTCRELYWRDRDVSV
jgi:hypothetical protein